MTRSFGTESDLNFDPCKSLLDFGCKDFGDCFSFAVQQPVV